MKATLRSLIILTITLSLVLWEAPAQDWSELEKEGDQLFEEGSYLEAVQTYNESAQLALGAGDAERAKDIFSKLGQCFSDDRLDDTGLLARYANSTAFAYVRAAEGETFLNATDYLRRAGYLFQFHGLTEQVNTVLSLYRKRFYDQVDVLLARAEDVAALGLWEIAGTSYYDAAVLLYGLEDERASNVFGLAATYLSQGGDVVAAKGGPWNLSQAAYLFHLAGASSQLNASDGRAYFYKAAETYSMAADEFMGENRLREAQKRLSEAARMYNRAGAVNLSKEKHLRAAEASDDLVLTTSYGGHLDALEAGKEYDSAGYHLEAGTAYQSALQLFPSTDLPWLHIELLEILGKGRRPKQARLFSNMLNSGGLGFVAFFGAPAFGGYDLMAELGSEVLDDASDNLVYRIYVLEKLFVAAGFLVNHLPDAALPALEGIPTEVLSMDPPNKALYDLLESILRLQQVGDVTRAEIEIKRVAVEDLFLEDLISILDDVPPSPLFLPLPRRESMYRFILADLDKAITYNKSVDYYYAKVQDTVDEVLDSRVRNTTKHLEVADTLGAIGWYWTFQGELNRSAFAFEQASFHACAGEDYQRAVLFRELTTGGLEARTFLSEASFLIAEAMIKDNQTLRDETRKYIVGNLSSYIDPRYMTILLSVLEGTTDLGGTPPTMRTIGMGFIAGFLLLTSYIILIWEPKHPQSGKGPSSTTDEETTETANAKEHARRTEVVGEDGEKNGKLEYSTDEMGVQDI